MSRKRKIRIRENSWLAKLAARQLGYDHVAMVVGHTIHLYNRTAAQFFQRPAWVRHELKHVEQYERYGFLGFLWRYAMESKRHGYRNNSLEVEARAAEGDRRMLEKYDLTQYRAWINNSFE